MRITILGTAIGLLVGVGALSAAGAEETNAYRETLEHYEAIRLSLVDDTMSGIETHARAIEERARGLVGDFDAGDAGVPAEKSDEAKALLLELAESGAELAQTENVEAAREALFELSKPMGRYRKLAGIEGTMVVFCPMAKKAWIQPHGEIGNPYMGQAMESCGEVVAD